MNTSPNASLSSTTNTSKINKRTENDGAITVREADQSWVDAIAKLVLPKNMHIADIGCGEGIYTRAFSRLGATSVIGIDSNPNILKDAVEDSEGIGNVEFREGDALNLDLPDQEFDLVHLRSLLHHVNSMQQTIAEACRILKPGGHLLIQDRTPEDVLMPPSRENIRGYFFEHSPKLVRIECENRFTELDLSSAILAHGLKGLVNQKLFEVRNVYPDVSVLEADLRRRRGRSILIHLKNQELEDLIEYICSQVSALGETSITEIDRWSLWYAQKVK